MTEDEVELKSVPLVMLTGRARDHAGLLRLMDKHAPNPQSNEPSAKLLESLATALEALQSENELQRRKLQGQAGLMAMGDQLAKANIADLTARAEKAAAENERLRAALTPSTETKRAYISEFETIDMHGNVIVVTWVATKEIMAAILARATLKAAP